MSTGENGVQARVSVDGEWMWSEPMSGCPGWATLNSRCPCDPALDTFHCLSDENGYTCDSFTHRWVVTYDLCAHYAMTDGGPDTAATLDDGREDTGVVGGG